MYVDECYSFQVALNLCLLPFPDAYGMDSGSVSATFQILHFIGWKPDKSQAQPALRGSATASLKDLAQVSKRQSNKEGNT